MQRSRELVDFVNEYSRIAFSVNCTRIYSAYDTEFHRVAFTNDRCICFSLNDEVCRLGSYTMRTTYSDRKVFSDDIMRVQVSKLFYSDDTGSDNMHLEGVGWIDISM